ncbi:MAG: hypothetical protein ACOCRN_02485, partial [Spirochaetia bacterium]
GLAGIISEESSPVAPEAIVERNPGIVYIGEVPDAYETFEENSHVSLDSGELLIYEGILSS